MSEKSLAWWLETWVNSARLNQGKFKNLRQLLRQAAERIEELESALAAADNLNDHLEAENTRLQEKLENQSILSLADFLKDTRLEDLQAENARLRDIIKFKDDLIEKLGQQVKDLREERDEYRQDIFDLANGPVHKLTPPLRRSAEEAVEQLENVWTDWKMVGDNTFLLRAADLIRELAGLEGKDV